MEQDCCADNNTLDAYTHASATVAYEYRCCAANIGLRNYHSARISGGVQPMVLCGMHCTHHKAQCGNHVDTSVICPDFCSTFHSASERIVLCQEKSDLQDYRHNARERLGRKGHGR